MGGDICAAFARGCLHTSLWRDFIFISHNKGYEEHCSWKAWTSLNSSNPIIPCQIKFLKAIWGVQLECREMPLTQSRVVHYSSHPIYPKLVIWSVPPQRQYSGCSEARSPFSTGQVKTTKHSHLSWKSKMSVRGFHPVTLHQNNYTYIMLLFAVSPNRLSQHREVGVTLSSRCIYCLHLTLAPWRDCNWLML